MLLGATMSSRLTTALVLIAPFHVWAVDFSCPEGMKHVVALPNDITSFQCLLETEPNHFVQVGPYVLTKGEKMILEMNYNIEGAPHGMLRTWDDSGKLTSEGLYVNGSRGGVWVTQENAQGLMRKAMYIDGILQSP